MILKSLGVAGKPSMNPHLAAILKKNELMASAAHRSTKVRCRTMLCAPTHTTLVTTDSTTCTLLPLSFAAFYVMQLTGELRLQQIKRGIAPGKTLRPACGSDSRWLGTAMTIARNNVLMQDYVEVALERSGSAQRPADAELELDEAELEAADSDADDAPALPADAADIDFSTSSWVLNPTEQRINLQLEGAMRPGADATLALEKSATASNDQ